jgi:hypothetical protein
VVQSYALARRQIKGLDQRLLNAEKALAKLAAKPEEDPVILQTKVAEILKRYRVTHYKTGTIRTVMNLPDSYASNHHLEVIAGIRENQCRQLLQAWFQTKRKNNC